MNIGFERLLLPILFILVIPLWMFYGYSSPQQCTGVVCPLIAAGNSGEDLVVRHTFGEGRHDLHGEIIAPTPCYKLESALEKQANDNVLIALTATALTDICIQQATPLSFFFSFFGPENVAVAAVLNGVPQSLRFVPTE